ncbi:flagellar hook-basal body complex protein FliE [bacterium]|nr:flagellar hook-basal body complex protein FliE [bacterium]
MIRSATAKPMDLGSIDADLRSMGGLGSSKSKATSAEGTSESQFLDLLKDGIADVNKGMRESEKASMDLATGKSSNIHETMLSVAKAELGFNMLVQMRNKAIEAYQDVMRMQV